MAFIKLPKKIFPILKLGIFISEKMTGKKMEAARLLSWYPKAAISSGILESLVAHEEEGISSRLLKLIRMQVSFSASCPFCIDMNSANFDRNGISDEEIMALQGKMSLQEVMSFNKNERIALEYTQALTRTPIEIERSLVKRMKQHYNEKQFVVIVTTIGQVNYWTRTIQGLGVKPAGFSDHCEILDIKNYTTLNNK